MCYNTEEKNKNLLTPRGIKVPDFKIEKEIANRGFKAIAGIDEVGRGALFGAVVAAAIILPLEEIKKKELEWVRGIDDSKRLSPSKREKLTQDILNHACSVGIGWATNYEIDQYNIYNSSLMAMRRAIKKLSIPPDFLLIDAFHLSGVNYPQLSLSQGDKKSISIACASIVAKVFRDRMIVSLSKVFKGYSLAQNKGYGTKKHYQGLKELGPTPFHRLTFNLKGEEPR